MRIPYGISSFSDIRHGGYFYADKTRFLPELESAEAGYRYLICLRPRRFGKSTLLSMLEHYYDAGKQDQFDALFGGLWIHEHPTPERGKYLVLSLDFSPVSTSGGPEVLYRTFFEVVRSSVESLLIRYRARIPDLARLDDRLSTYQDPEALMLALLRLVGVRFIDLLHAVTPAFVEDGVHPNGKGQLQIAEALWRGLVEISASR